MDTVRSRSTRLREADGAYDRAEKHRGRARHLQAAKQYEHAAELYHLASLGLLAKRAYAIAAAAYEHVEDADGSHRCFSSLPALGRTDCGGAGRDARPGVVSRQSRGEPGTVSKVANSADTGLTPPRRRPDMSRQRLPTPGTECRHHARRSL